MSQVIEGWKCEIVAGGYRRASWAGVVIIATDDGRLLTERANVPADVVSWLLLPVLTAVAKRCGEETVASIRAYLNEAGVNLPTVDVETNHG